ncbi:uncharacterized protein LOC141601085 [Silene latifolia]|uniref:uncharacterized protein LOC141601085 n=1 Tax=Silene latifolia TaxID=37657 RepID=UPI003D787366
MGIKNLTIDEKEGIVHFLMANSESGVPHKGKISEAALKWSISRKTVWLWWKRAKEISSDKAVHLPSRMLGNTNAPTVPINIEMIKSMPFKNRSSMRKIAKKLKVGYGTVQRWVEKGELKKHSNPIHPSLNDSNKLRRLLFSLASIYVEENIVKFKDMSCNVHIDEKWFYLTTTTDNYYIVAGEEPPYRSCQSKRYITKVMFMCAVARPIYGEDGELLFDGKIGVFPFVEQVPAARRSKNREAGTIETKAIDSITKQVTKHCLINDIIPAIKAKWPANASKNICIQQDNARPHIVDHDPKFRAAASSDGFNIHLQFQPPNSPYLNINDLGFFRSLQTLQNDEVASTVEELVGNVHAAFRDHEPMKLNFNFLTLQSVMVEIMKCKGHNSFDIPHMSKESLLRQGILPLNLMVDANLVRDCLAYLDQMGEGSSLNELRQGMALLPAVEVVPPTEVNDTEMEVVVASDE